MGQPVWLSDELVDDARAVVLFSQRSMAGQLEFCAGLRKSIEPLLRGDRVLSLQIAGAERALSKILSEVDTAKGSERLEVTLNSRPYRPRTPDTVASMNTRERLKIKKRLTDFLAVNQRTGFCGYVMTWCGRIPACGKTFCMSTLSYMPALATIEHESITRERFKKVVNSLSRMLHSLTARLRLWQFTRNHFPKLVSKLTL